MATTVEALSPRPENVSQDQVMDVDIYHLPGAEEDFYGAWARIQREAPADVIWTPHNGGHWIALRGRQIQQVLSDYKHFSNRRVMVPAQRADDLQVLPTVLDPPIHGKFRSLINPPLSAKSVKEMEAFIRKTAIDLIERVRLQGHCDFVTDYADQLPISVFMNMVNLPLSDAPRLKKIGNAVSRDDPDMNMVQAMEALQAYLAPFIEERRAVPGTDALSGVINGKVDGERISFDQAMDMSVQLLVAGLDTVVNFLSFSMLYLGSNPGQLAELAANPDLVPAATDELLRRHGLISPTREVVEDYEFGGAMLASGDLIVAPTFLHAFDDREYDEPLAVDFHRVVHDHSTFGAGPHRCAGSMLARTEARITFEEWMKRIPAFTVDRSKPIRMNGGIAGTVFSVPLLWDVE